jgi:cytochrome c peroxidase
MDEGRYTVSELRDHAAFTTPTLPNLPLTAPYMHDGSIATLEGVVDFYSEGGRTNPHVDPKVQPRHFTSDEKTALAAFLRTLNGPVQEGAPYMLLYFEPTIC